MTNAAGATGNLDITAKLLTPTGDVIREAVKMKQGEFNLQASIEGDYQFCFDNRF